MITVLLGGEKNSTINNAAASQTFCRKSVRWSLTDWRAFQKETFSISHLDMLLDF